MTALVQTLGGAARRVDFATGAILLIFLVLSIALPEQAKASFAFVLYSFLGVLLFLLISIALAACAKASGADALIAKAFSGQPAMMIVGAALMGALSPFCSCGVIPLIAALLAMGVPLPAVMAFWLSSPLMDPSMFVLNLGNTRHRIRPVQNPLGDFDRSVGRFWNAAIAGPHHQQSASPGSWQWRLRCQCGSLAQADCLAVLARIRALAEILECCIRFSFVLGQMAIAGLFARKSDGGLCSSRTGDQDSWR